MNQSDYAIKRDRAAEALRGLMVLPKGRSIRRFTHGCHAPGESYFVGYTWSRTYSNPMTGNVYDVTLGVGTDFDSALADAIQRETKKRGRRDAKHASPSRPI